MKTAITILTTSKPVIYTIHCNMFFGDAKTAYMTNLLSTEINDMFAIPKEFNKHFPTFSYI